MYMYNQLSIAPPYSGHFVISYKYILYRGFLNSGHYFNSPWLSTIVRVTKVCG